MEPKDAPVLEGAQVWTPPPAIEQRLLEEHRTMAARERPAEPEVVTVFPRILARGEGSATYVAGPAGAGGAAVRELRLQHGYLYSESPLTPCVERLWSVRPGHFRRGAGGDPQPLAGCLVYRPDTDVLRLLVHPGAASSALAVRGAEQYAADMASVFFQQAAVNGAPMRPVETVWWGPYVGTWRLAGVQLDEPRCEGDGDRVDPYVRCKTRGVSVSRSASCRRGYN